ncbi:hypothetical protein HanRHA438_Chr08g0336841 [Helianthus annuus]|nr:hypothetical protein HanIR_Chr08g0351891 [Helianthus annuus]KAJ0896636.1 hypothetical protein HanRHA438_Chr08g0336841 [Helianthus annuus]
MQTTIFDFNRDFLSLTLTHNLHPPPPYDTTKPPPPFTSSKETLTLTKQSTGNPNHSCKQSIENPPKKQYKGSPNPTITAVTSPPLLPSHRCCCQHVADAVVADWLPAGWG